MIKFQLREILAKKDLNQADLARMTGIRPTTISYLYHGFAKRIQLEYIDLICEALDVKVDELIVREPDPEIRQKVNRTRRGTPKKESDHGNGHPQE